MSFNERVSSGIIELDALLDGGYQDNSMILVAGNPGAGKTILSSTFIYEGAIKYKEPGVYACFAETKKRLLLDMKQFGFDFPAQMRRNLIEVLDLSIGSETEVQSA